MPDQDSPETAPPDRPLPPPDPGAGAAQPAPAVSSPRRKAILGWCIQQVRKFLPVVWRFVCEVVRYYWGIREPLKEYVAGFSPNLLSESVRLREVRLAPYETHPLAEFGSDGWKLSVPGRCVVCGEPTSKPAADQTRAVDDASRAFTTPVVVMLFGGTVGWFLLGRWIAILSIPLAFVVGYLLRTRVPVRMRVVRCDAHATRTNIPQVLAWGNMLVVRFGNKAVRNVFRYGETMTPVVPPTEAAPPEMSATSALPQTIPLADTPDPDAARIRHDPSPTFGDERASPDRQLPSQ